MTKDQFMKNMDVMHFHLSSLPTPTRDMWQAKIYLVGCLCDYISMRTNEFKEEQITIKETI